MSTVVTLRRPDEANELAAALLNACPGRRIFALQGQLGVGKTTLIKAMCQELGITSGMSSPSYSLVNEYRMPDQRPVYHFDLYRLRKADELDGIGFVEYLDSGADCFVEWPELARAVLPPEVVILRMRESSGGQRMVELDLEPLAFRHA